MISSLGEQRRITDEPGEVMYLRVTQHPKTFLKSQAGQSTASGNTTVKVEKSFGILGIDRIVAHQKSFGSSHSPRIDNIEDYHQDHKIVLTYPADSEGEKRSTWFVFSEHVDIHLPDDTSKLAHVIMPRVPQGTYLKQSTGDKENLDDDNLFHLHAGKGLYLEGKGAYPESLHNEDSKHYKVKLTKPLNGKITWYVLKEEIEVWLEFQGPRLVLGR